MAPMTFISWIYYFWARFWPCFNFVDFRAHFGHFPLVIKGKYVKHVCSKPRKMNIPITISKNFLKSVTWFRIYPNLLHFSTFMFFTPPQWTTWCKPVGLGTRKPERMIDNCEVGRGKSKGKKRMKGNKYVMITVQSFFLCWIEISEVLFGRPSQWEKEVGACQAKDTS